MFEKRVPFSSGHRTGPKTTTVDYLPQPGDYLYLPVPSTVDEGLGIRDKSVHQAGSALTPISPSATKPHWAVVKSISDPFTAPNGAKRYYALAVYIVRSFGSNFVTYMRLPASKRRWYLPIPPVLCPGPPDFSPDLGIDGLINTRMSWLDSDEVTFNMATSQNFRRLEPHVQLLPSEMARIDTYATNLRLEFPPEAEEKAVIDKGDGTGPKGSSINDSHDAIRQHPPPPDIISPRPMFSAAASSEGSLVAISEYSMGTSPEESPSIGEEEMLRLLAPKVYEKYMAEKVEAQDKITRDRIGNIAKWRLGVE
ncbi:hypothetical protein BOTBODRAFT_58413 [Botryobasidium botryosum FD-172 SS1]|uniref:Uncharacterized protein n=1 Tax=Botryobasidium botryosum (strain FD-172 SS1) TaxID=930990 RepID=A0A067ME92_BOTB1|nr:hypothetical protein BOTBODRAFT_58413 [Botryobasidium botryosum FD-172 SS1]